MAEINCRHFTGYRPCGLNESCDSECPHYSPVSSRILVVHLEALGAVLRATSILPALRRKYPGCHITWVTQKPAQHLLEGVVDRVLTLDLQDLLVLKALEFDVAYGVDKSLKASGVLKECRFTKFYGFRAEAKTGAILPTTVGAMELWELGLSNNKKFFVNQKPETQLLVEALELGLFKRDSYQLKVSDDEMALAFERRREWAPHRETVIGLNTGCSAVIPYKKLTIEAHRDLVRRLGDLAGVRVVLLGGQEDTERNLEISRGLKVCLSPTELGLRDGMASILACDLVVSGDSLGMHMAIGLKKWVVAWFGPTCAQEIDLYDRGVKVLSSAHCAPCWKRVCRNEPMCYDQVDLNQIVDGVKEGIKWSTSLSKQPLLETSSSLSP